VTVRVSSGNEAKLTVLRSGGRAILDAEWRRTPTQVDKEELARLLHIGDRALSLNVEDDSRRGEVVREFLSGGPEPERTQ
jgi:hypothetical protein